VLSTFVEDFLGYCCFTCHVRATHRQNFRITMSAYLSLFTPQEKGKSQEIKKMSEPPPTATPSVDVISDKKPAAGEETKASYNLSPSKTPTPERDLGLKKEEAETEEAVGDVTNERWAWFRNIFEKIVVFGRVELRGVTPIPVKERTQTQTINIFTLWWSMNANILP
jgi:hypothetical protein